MIVLKSGSRSRGGFGEGLLLVAAGYLSRKPGGFETQRAQRRRLSDVEARWDEIFVYVLIVKLVHFCFFFNLY